MAKIDGGLFMPTKSRDEIVKILEAVRDQLSGKPVDGVDTSMARRRDRMDFSLFRPFGRSAATFYLKTGFNRYKSLLKGGSMVEQEALANSRDNYKHFFVLNAEGIKYTNRLI